MEWNSLSQQINSTYHDDISNYCFLFFKKISAVVDDLTLKSVQKLQFAVLLNCFALFIQSWTTINYYLKYWLKFSSWAQFLRAQMDFK